ncbi:MAG: exodeoxyribonuclease VII small subunit [Bifidobacteriaceae bacterium]|jgi:exodeoxyribonuclease VII small subunit|nr:exodeoxyribonuclease VII small subunit [Bifidobacteriaceae bacterium]
MAQGAQNEQADQNNNTTDDTKTVVSSLSAEEREKIAALSYEEARDQLVQAVQALEAGGLDLDASMQQWERGEALAQRAQALLDEVRGKLDAAQEQQASAGAQAGTQGNME